MASPFHPCVLLLCLAPTLLLHADLPPAATAALIADFPTRDQLPQSPTPESAWYQRSKLGSWGPKPTQYPAVAAPVGVDALAWKRARVAAVARKYIGLAYQHHHVPAWTPPWADPEGKPQQAGLDCSNFTSWVYNYGLGVSFTSHVEDQAEGPKAPGRRLSAEEPLQEGDLLFIQNQAKTRISHVVIYLDEAHIIDSHAEGVRVRPFRGWYKKSFSHARRVVE